eukprot:Lithocolla_globosa_v1_NODE_743_length_3354_cov_15.787814.p4 type:complete len:187 gc:universal NODE_743_length_3354_cov_15.787814:1966-1406(-)
MRTTNVTHNLCQLLISIRGRRTQQEVVSSVHKHTKMNIVVVVGHSRHIQLALSFQFVADAFGFAVQRLGECVQHRVQFSHCATNLGHSGERGSGSHAFESVESLHLGVRILCQPLVLLQKHMTRGNRVAHFGVVEQNTSVSFRLGPRTETSCHFPEPFQIRVGSFAFIKSIQQQLFVAIVERVQFA